ncbi:Rieske (2Fe-2S) domain protein [Gloeothece citriformis PCC 7424]|uniref:Rieske (2Fe-2S) domain protein n=1 Tax=Gloeothece citriformis (strain PCC 7424) TaxID=65393 RepID=B7KIL4_GLOC7|nr:Rieske 2Fe-2S domain-containing protein [Gloeothece citriformis]ACK69420.1 Rieske (2Fe-2S) domain protein [Gloeothece citriformis PCC 7424]
MNSQFSWTKQWYPVMPLSYLDASSPTPITLLGKKLVIWRNERQKWVVMDDYCPHKLMQLSKGTITEEGHLMCRHHGWCFNGEGQCTHIPMLGDTQAQQTACNSLKSQVRIYPTQVLQGLLWVWPDESPTAFEESSTKQPATIPECDPDVCATDWHMSDVPVGYTVSVESTFDPSHANFLHEGLGGFSPQTAVPITEFNVVGQISAEDGFTLKHGGYKLDNQDMDATRKFSPPCCNTTVYRYTNGKSLIFQLYFIPTKPGYCRYIGKFITEGNSQTTNSIFKLLPKDLRTGLMHLFTYKLGDQDLTAMHSQETIESSLNQPWQKAYFMPSPADVGIVTFRKWLDEFAGGQPAWQGNLQKSHKSLSDEQLYDRWHRHTKHCPSCRNSVIFIEKVQKACNIATIGLVLLTLVFSLLNLPLTLVLATTGLGVLSLFFSEKLEDIRHLFLSSIPRKGLPVVKVFPTQTQTSEK